MKFLKVIKKLTGVGSFIWSFVACAALNLLTALFIFNLDASASETAARVLAIFELTVLIIAGFYALGLLLVSFIPPKWYKIVPSILLASVNAWLLTDVIKVLKGGF